MLWYELCYYYWTVIVLYDTLIYSIICLGSNSNPDKVAGDDIF